MPKKIDDRTFEAVKKAYLESKVKPDRQKLADKFCVGLSTLNNWAAAGKWESLRESAVSSRAEGKVEGAKVATRSRGAVDDFELLNNAIADISAEIAAIEAKSKEGCANAMANLLKAKRELYPPNAEELAEMAVKLGITPADFIRALKTKWAEHDPSQQTA
jgi:hypothetical protein